MPSSAPTMHRVGLEPTTPLAQPLAGQGLTEPTTPSQTKYATKSAHGTPADPDLAAVVAAWPELPKAIRAGILAMVRAAGAGE